MSLSQRKFTDTEMMIYYNKGFVDRETALIFGCSHVAVTRRRYKLGLEANGRGFANNKILSEIEMKERYSNFIEKNKNKYHENISKNAKCIDCGSLINVGNMRCHRCAAKNWFKDKIHLTQKEKSIRYKIKINNRCSCGCLISVNAKKCPRCARLKKSVKGGIKNE